MSRKNKVPLADRVTQAAEAALAAQHFVSPIDIFLGMGWLDQQTVERWRRRQIDFLERVVQSNLPRITEAMTLFRSWARTKGLYASQTAYVSRMAQRRELRFSRRGNSSIETEYRTHWISPKLSEKKRECLEEKASNAPELSVLQPLNTGWACHRCQGTGDFMMMEDPGPVCLRCVGLDDLVFLPAGDALLTRRVKAKKRQTRSRPAFQQEPRSLREARTAGRTAGLG